MSPGRVRHIQEAYLRDSPLPRFEVSEWLEQYGVTAGATAGRDDLDFALADAGTSVDLWTALADAVGGFRAIVVSRQPHGAVVAAHSGLPPGLSVLKGLDGHVTNQENLLLAITVADCVPIYLVEPESGAIGILHAGWRGTAAGILEAGIRALADISNTPVGAIVMHCGIAICGSCYEVGPEVVEVVTGERPAGPGPLDLRRALMDRASRLGLRQISASRFCTAHDRALFHSYRASGHAAGRMAAYIGRHSG